MDIINETPLPTEIMRDFFQDKYILTVALTKATYDVSDKGSLTLSRDQIPVHRGANAEAPEGEVHATVEPGVVDLTAIGHIVPKLGRPSRSVDVVLSWGDQAHRIRAFGPRFWEKSVSGELCATTPEPFERLPMVWENAFGGRHKIPAGFAPGTDMPMPSGELAYAKNPSGMGFYVKEEDALGAPLPRLEDPDALVRTYRDQPTPRCLAPCPMDSYLRAEHIRFDEKTGRMSSIYGEEEMLFARCSQSAAPALQTRALGPGTPIRLEGMTPDKPIAFTVPPCPVVWKVLAGDRATRVVPKIRAVQLRPDEYRVTILVRADIYVPYLQYEERSARLCAVTHGEEHSPWPRA